MAYINYINIISEIKDRISIEEIFDLHFPGNQLTRRGNRLWACCPFHKENTPSFMMDIQKQRFACHGCHIYGDSIDLYAKANGLTNTEAIRQMAVELGISRKANPKTRKAIQIARKKIEYAAAINKDLEETVKAARLDCWSMERWIYILKKHIYQERDLERLGPAFAFQNLSYIEHLGDTFIDGNLQEQLKAAAAFRRWEEWQHANGMRL